MVLKLFALEKEQNIIHLLNIPHQKQFGDHYGLTKERAENESGMNPKMFNSFLCGDKSCN